MSCYFTRPVTSFKTSNDVRTAPCAMPIENYQIKNNQIITLRNLKETLACSYRIVFLGNM